MTAMDNLHFFDILMEVLPKKPLTICFPIHFDKYSGLYSIASKFNGSPNYCIINLAEKKFSLISDTEIFSYFIKEKTDINSLNIDAVISPMISPMSHKILNDNNIKVYVPVSQEIIINIELLLLKELQLYDDKSSKKTSICSDTSCKSCPSTCN